MSSHESSATRQMSGLTQAMQKHFRSDPSIRYLSRESSKGTEITSALEGTGEISESDDDYEVGDFILERLESNNDPHFDSIIFNGDLVSHVSSKAELLQAISTNRTLKHVTVEECFFKALRGDQAGILLSTIGRLPKLETIKIHFPNRLNDDTLVSALFNNAINHGGEALRTIEVHGLRIVEGFEEAQELAEAFSTLTNLKKLRIIDFAVYHDADVDPFLETLGNMFALEELEIRMKRQERLHGMFLQSICTSPTIRKLILWNILFDMMQTSHMLEAIQENVLLQRFEIWRCDLGPTFGIMLSEMLQNNTSLTEVVISNVNFYGSGMVTLTNALRTNETIKDFTLFNIGNCNESTVSKTSMQLLFRNCCIKSMNISFEAMDEAACIEADKALRHNREIKENDRERMKNKGNEACGCKNLLERLFVNK